VIQLYFQKRLFRLVLYLFTKVHIERKKALRNTSGLFTEINGTSAKRVFNDNFGFNFGSPELTYDVEIQPLGKLIKM